MDIGNAVFSDRDYVIMEIPELLKDAQLIQTANNDKYNKDSSFLSLDITEPSVVCVHRRHVLEPRYAT